MTPTPTPTPSPEAEALPTLPVVVWRYRQSLTPHAPAEAAIVALRAEVAELRKDAERYRWLREHACNYSDGYDGPELAMRTHGPDWPAEIDAAIDAARASLLGDGGTL